MKSLAIIVEQQLSLQAIDGSVFVFCNKGRDKLKILYWDSTGFALWYNRNASGRAVRAMIIKVSCLTKQK
ncbi:IS66 family insertion sequence element accessory protein TnpB [Shewanella sp. 125m-7]